jgi:arylsulfatase A-like enzyme
MSAGERLRWIAAAVGLGVAFGVGAAVVAWGIGRRAHGLVLAAFLALHVGLLYRFEVVLNEFVRDPRVWGGLLGIAVVSLGLGLLVDPLLRRTRPVVIGLVGVGLLGAGVGFVEGTPPAARQLSPRKSVLVVTLDTLRPDAIGAYATDLVGGGKNLTPVMDRLAAEGVLYEQAVATAPLTEPSHLAILTGVPPHRTGVVSNGTELGDRPELLQRVLHGQGWNTAGFVSGFPLHGKYGWRQGMDVYDDDFGRFRGLHRLSIVQAVDQLVLPGNTLRERRGDLAVDRALTWLDSVDGAPFFLWLHLFDAHAPYESPDHSFDPPRDGSALALPAYWPPPHRSITSEAWLTRAYQAEVSYVDAQVGRVIDRLRAQGRLDDTIIVLTADHGESLTEHGYLFDHGDDLYDPSLLVPLIVRAPGQAQAGLRLRCQVGNLDVAPTVLGMLGLEAGGERVGTDRTAELAGGGCREEWVMATTVAGRFMEDPPLDHALRGAGHKLIEKGEDGATSCFDLGADPGELQDLGAACPPELVPLMSLERRGAVKSAATAEDVGSMEALRALGYVE